MVTPVWEGPARAGRIFFSGIGGSGMSALAALLRLQGCDVAGSDRGRDAGQTSETLRQLAAMGVRLFPQDGSGVPGAECVVISSAIENTVTDIVEANRLGIPIRKRAELLAELFNARQGIGVAGTSGKTTVTAMVGQILAHCGRDPLIVNGGLMLNRMAEDPDGLANIRAGGGRAVAEIDESDGSIALFDPAIALVNNVTLDHKPLEELAMLFGDYLARATTGAILNADDPAAMALAGRARNPVTFGLADPRADFRAIGLETSTQGSRFILHCGDGTPIPCALRVPGRHNVANALAALACSSLADVPVADAVVALAGFLGTHRRLETVGSAGGITVIDDFAHNPDKIAASLDTFATHPGRVLAMFQPHGYAPMRLMRAELAQAFAHGLREADRLYMPEIFYAGGTAVRDISSQDIVGDVRDTGRHAYFCENRAEAAKAMIAEARAGDIILVMGARDDSLPAFVRDILSRLRN